MEKRGPATRAKGKSKSKTKSGSQVKPTDAGGNPPGPGKPSYSLAAFGIFLVSSFGSLVFSKVFGMEFLDAARKVLVENAPLTVAIAIISVRLYTAEIDDDSLPLEIVYAALLLCAAGFASQLISGHAIFDEAFSKSQGKGLGHFDLLARIFFTCTYTITGYIRFYGAKEFLMTAVTGAAIPWVLLHKYKNFVKDAKAAAVRKA